MPHVAMVIPSLAGGGAERTALRLSGGLAARGHEVDIVLFQPHIAYPGEVPEAARLLVLCGRRTWDRRNPHAMPARERTGILFANLPQAEHAAFYAARLAGPSCQVVHNVERADSRHTRRCRLLFPSAAHVVAVSRGVAENAAAAAGLPEARLSVVYNPAVTPSALGQADREPDRPWFADGGPPVLLGVGRLAPQKDFPTLIEAFRRVAAERPCRLLILGEGPMRPEIEGPLRALGLNGCASLPGWAENPYAFMARAALFVLSARPPPCPGRGRAGGVRKSFPERLREIRAAPDGGVEVEVRRRDEARVGQKNKGIIYRG